MLNITTVILTYNEERHIRRCLENVCPFSKKVIVVDSPSTDRTVAICHEFDNVEVVVHKYPGNQAEQFNWALDNCQIGTEWILRVDADEYLLPELVDELNTKLPHLPDDVTGIELKRRHIFMGRWMKHGIYPVVMMRLCRRGCGRYAARLMDEHMVLTRGRSIVMDNDFCDHSLISIDDYCRKHIDYARREAAVVLDEKYSLSHINTAKGMSDVRADESLGAQAVRKHMKKSRYNSLPLFWRSTAYFVYRYILKGGFLDGKEGFVFAFIQGWWYRMLVDVKIMEVQKACGTDKEKILEYMKTYFNIDLSQCLTENKMGG